MLDDDERGFQRNPVRRKKGGHSSSEKEDARDGTDAHPARHGERNNQYNKRYNKPKNQAKKAKMILKNTLYP